MNLGKTKKIIILVIFYLITILFYLYIYGKSFWQDNVIIIYYSKLLFIMCYIIIPTITLLIPTFLRKKGIKSIFYTIPFVIAYIPLLFVINYSISIYLKDFTQEKWNNTNRYIKHHMIENFEKEYIPIGKSKTYIESILGNNYDDGYEDRKNSSSICYLVDISLFHPRFYCLEYDKNEIIISTSRNW